MYNAGAVALIAWYIVTLLLKMSVTLIWIFLGLDKDKFVFDLFKADIRIFSKDASECFYPDPLKGLPGIVKMLYSGLYKSK
jgi:hypothetical protein